MTKCIYKYADANVVDQIIPSSGVVTVKCSLPKDFNDPYELFLTIDFSDRPEILAFYSEIIGELPQLPTTCFSRSPTVTPMWAHYARNLQGFVIEFLESKISRDLNAPGFGDIDYRDETDGGLKELLYRAYEIGKPRYLYMLRNGVFSSAYYTKMSYWSYEQERRMIVDPGDVSKVDEMILLDIPKDSVKSLIIGPRASQTSIEKIQEKAELLNCECFEMRIGRTSGTPYFVDLEGNSYVFDSSAINRSTSFCISCKEPLAADSEKCSWCQIDRSHTKDAAERNIFRAYARLGMLDDYIRDMDQITRDHHDDT